MHERRTVRSPLGSLVTVAAMSVVAMPGAAGVPGLGPGIHELLLQPGDRRLTIAIPEGYTGAEPVPLVLALHYGGRVTPFFGGGVLRLLVEPGLAKLGAIIVAPDCTGKDWTDPQSERDVLQLLDVVESTFNVDRRRTLVTGYSMGGIGAWYLAERHQDRFAAALVMAGSPPEGAAEADWTIPLYVIHSVHDEVVPIGATKRVVKRLKARGVDITLKTVVGVTHYQTPSFAESLRAAVPWIEKAWSKRAAAAE